MTKEARIQHIDNIKKGAAFGRIELPWKDKLESMDVYQIPLEYLVYNKYNGRILTRTKSLEKQGHVIDVESQEGKKLIEKLLWESKEDRNKKTLKSLEKYGQEKIGIVTRDGIVIDGNRRTMLLNKIPSIRYLKAVILPVTLEDDPLEIEKLETSYQMGEDEKLSYNPIEKYLKVKELMLKLSSSRDENESINNISEWMNESTSEIKKYLSVIETMDEYLDYFNYNGMYTQLDGREDPFLFLNKWLKTFYGSESRKAFDGYMDSDVDDLKMIGFEYIRAQYEGKSFRRLADGNKDKHIFGNKDIWNSFADAHFQFTGQILDDEVKIDYNSSDIEAHLNDRDMKFKKLVEGQLDENLNDHYQQIKNKEFKNQPEKLVKSAMRSIESIGSNHEMLKNDDVQEVIKGLQRTVDKLQSKSPLRSLEHIHGLLKEIDFENIDESSDEELILNEVKEISKTLFDIKKSLGG